MNFKPEKNKMGDTWQFSDGDTIHTFFLQWNNDDDRSDPMSGSIGHITSHDMVHWNKLPPALIKGHPGSYDELDLWTGCCVEHMGTKYLYYASRNSRDPYASAISLATSKDGVYFNKHENNPLFTPDPRYYCSFENRTNLAVHGSDGRSIVDCRDICIVRDDERNCWWGFFAARRHANECTQTSVVGLCRTDDLVHFEQLPPCFTPDKYHCIDTPDVFFMNGKWYMLFMTGNHFGHRNTTNDPNMTGVITLYAVADKPEGPYTEIHEDNVLLGSTEMSGICARTVLHQGKRYLFYTQSHFNPALHKSSNTLSYPKEVVCDKDGRLHLMWCNNVETLYDVDVNYPKADNAILNDGKWGTVCPIRFGENSVSIHPKYDWAVQMFDIYTENFVLDTTVTVDGARSCGIIFDMQGDTIHGANNMALFDFFNNEVLFSRVRNFPKINAKKYDFSRSKTFHLKLLVHGPTVEIYVNNELVVHHQKFGRVGGRIGFLSEMGKTIFKNSVVHLIAD